MQVRIHHGPICQPLYFIHLRWGKYSQRPEIYGRLQSGLVYTALLLIPLCLYEKHETVFSSKYPWELQREKENDCSTFIFKCTYLCFIAWYVLPTLNYLTQHFFLENNKHIEMFFSLQFPTIL